MPPAARHRVNRQDWWKALRASTLPANARLLALVLSTWMNADGSRCFPGQDAIAEACGWSAASTVRRALTDLEQAGYVEVQRYAGTRHQGRSQKTHRYWPTVPTDPDQSRTGAREDGPDQSRVAAREEPDQSRTDARQERPVENGDQSRTGARSQRRPVAQSDPTSRANRPDQSRATARQGVQRGDTQREVPPNGHAQPADFPPPPATPKPLSWSQAWARIERHVKRYGQHDPDRPRLELDPLAAEVLAQLGGISAVRRDEVNQWDFRDAHLAAAKEPAR